MSITPGPWVCGLLDLDLPCHNPNSLLPAGLGCGWTTAGGSWLIVGNGVQTTSPGSLIDNAATPMAFPDYIPPVALPPGVQKGYTIAGYFSSSNPWTCSLTHDGTTISFNTSSRTFTLGGQSTLVPTPPIPTLAQLILSFTTNDGGEQVVVGYVVWGSSGDGSAPTYSACLAAFRAAPLAGKRTTYSVDACTAAVTVAPRAYWSGCTGATCRKCGGTCDTGYTLTAPTSVTIEGATGLIPGFGCDCASYNGIYTNFTQGSNCSIWISANRATTPCPGGATINLNATIAVATNQILVELAGIGFVRFKKTLVNFGCHETSVLEGVIPPDLTSLCMAGPPTCTVVW